MYTHPNNISTCVSVWVQMCVNIRFDPWISRYLCIFREPVAVSLRDYALVWMRAGAIEAVLSQEVWCLQQENCHKQSAPASVKREAWVESVAL